MKTGQREILHVDIDAFFASVEQACDPALAGRPVIVCGDPSGRSVVSSASYDARRMGVRQAMDIARAGRLCPGAALVRADFEKYRRFASGFLDILDSFTPDVEPLSMDEAYLDLTGCRRLHGPALDAADRIRGRIKKILGLDASIGIGGSRTVARVASSIAKPSGILYVLPGQGRGFLSPLPMRALPGVGEALSCRLLRLGVRTVGDLAAIEADLLTAMFGTMGGYLHLASRGVAPPPAARPRRRDQKSIRREVAFARDTDDRDSIEAALSLLVERACGALRELGLCAGSLTVKLRYSDFATVTRTSPLSPPTDIDFTVFRKARELFHAAYGRRLKLRLLGVSLGGLQGGTLLPDFFDEYGLNKYKKIYCAADRIRARYNFEAILSARSLQGLKMGGQTRLRP